MIVGYAFHVRNLRSLISAGYNQHFHNNTLSGAKTEIMTAYRFDEVHPRVYNRTKEYLLVY
ncbi:hypothetical protein Ppha_0611 [Pelodictyon phaeoclathratiforme BU-1]|jgi:hypothetical protein|uniref:Uncharacterized protein n=1 Tax=Pelodictyon phaeoclathratiforme (strain DSM 5477 / BU-1) TaxID=324925 RepID=B4SDH4_PELPB|nr:hypothetical protein Ppha_0611 [Pelodictyon phaeoclathratiforme BU-1]